MNQWQRDAVTTIVAAMGTLSAMGARNLRRILGSTSISQAANALPWDQFRQALAAIQGPMQAAIMGTADTTARSLFPQMGIRFDIIDPRSVEFAEQMAGRLITEITDDQLLVVRDALARSMRGGLTVDDMADELSRTIGLHSRYAQAVSNSWQTTYAQGLKDGLTDARARDIADRVAEAYRQRLINSRAMTIARTEINSAQAFGRYQGWEEAIAQGYASPNSMKKWITADPCDLCAPMDGETVPWNGNFSNGVSMPPMGSHPNCECVAILVK